MRGGPMSEYDFVFYLVPHCMCEMKVYSDGNGGRLIV